MTDKLNTHSIVDLDTGDRVSSEAVNQRADGELVSVWTPQLGAQSIAYHSPCDMTAYGGTRGCGKSDITIGRHLKGAEKYGIFWNGLIIRKTYKQLGEIKRRLKELIALGLKANLIGGDEKAAILRFHKGGQVHLRAIQFMDDCEEYQGHQYTEISIEEATNFPFLEKMVDKLKGSLRSAHGVPCRMFFTANPGGPGHLPFKRLFYNPSTPGIPFKTAVGESCVFVQASPADNPILLKNDPMYFRRLQSIKDENLKRAWLYGDWNILAGNAFPEFRRDVHVVAPFKIPKHWFKWRAIDYGYSAPACCLWFAADEDGKVYIYRELYVTKFTPQRLAKTIVDLSVGEEFLYTVADPACWSEHEGSQTKARKMMSAGLYGLRKANNDRTTGKQEIHERLFIEEEKYWDPDAMEVKFRYSSNAVIFDTCDNLIEQISSIPVDSDNIEDVDTDAEDHAYDALRYGSMERPVQTQKPVEDWRKVYEEMGLNPYKDVIIKNGRVYSSRSSTSWRV